MNDRFAFFLDIDGTLYNDGSICPRNSEAIEKVRANGHLVFINTARILGQLPEEVVALDVDGYITSIGGTVVSRGKVLLHDFIPLDDVCEIFDLVTSAGRKMRIADDNLIISNPFFPYDDNIVSSGKELKEKYPGIRIAKCFMPEILTPEEQAFIGERTNFYQHRSYSEFGVKGHSKGTGIDVVMKEFSIPRDHCVAMGDSINDSDMLRAAGISVAMGDATAEVIAICDMVTCNAAEGGVAEAMMKITGLG